MGNSTSIPVASRILVASVEVLDCSNIAPVRGSGVMCRPSVRFVYNGENNATITATVTCVGNDSFEISDINGTTRLDLDQFRYRYLMSSEGQHVPIYEIGIRTCGRHNEDGEHRLSREVTDDHNEKNSDYLELWKCAPPTCSTLGRTLEMSSFFGNDYITAYRQFLSLSKSVRTVAAALQMLSPMPTTRFNNGVDIYFTYRSTSGSIEPDIMSVRPNYDWYTTDNNDVKRKLKGSFIVFTESGEDHGIMDAQMQAMFNDIQSGGHGSDDEDIPETEDGLITTFEKIMHYIKSDNASVDIVSFVRIGGESTVLYHCPFNANMVMDETNSAAETNRRSFQACK